MSHVPADEVWTFLLTFYERGDTGVLGILADRLEEAGDPRGVRLRKRWRAQPGYVERAEAAGGHRPLLAEVRLQQYVLDLFPECEARYSAWAGKHLATAFDQFRLGAARRQS